MSKKKEKKKYVNRIVNLRGGFSPKPPFRIPKYISTPLQKELTKVITTNTSPERVSKFINTVITRAAGNKSNTAVRILRELSKPVSVKVADGIAKLVQSPIGGVSAPEGSTIPILNDVSWRLVSGKNSLYTAKEYKVSFKAGNSSGRWLRELAKTNGTTVVKDRDTTESYHLDNATRTELVQYAGGGQKAQLFISPNNFGYTAQEVAPFFSVAGLDTSKIYEQKAYGAISKLTSKMTVTSLNRYIPMYVNIHLMAINNPKLVIGDAFSQALNTDLVGPTQANGAMPVYSQQDTYVAQTFSGGVHVDPKSRGVFASDNFSANFTKIQSKRIKLYAGDHVNITYDHLFSSGVSLDDLFSVVKESGNYSASFPITYILMLEVWGEEVDIYSNEVPPKVIKATAPCAFQMEFSKSRTGLQPLWTPSNQYNPGSINGYYSEQYAVKVYSKAPTRTTIKRWFGAYDKLDVDYKVPVMSDATEQDGGQIE